MSGTALEVRTGGTKGRNSAAALSVVPYEPHAHFPVRLLHPPEHFWFDVTELKAIVFRFSATCRIIVRLSFDQISPFYRSPVTSHPHLGSLHGVPAQRPHYRPRPRDLVRLKHALLEGTDSAVGITAPNHWGLHGQGGIGKSVLAVALSRDTDVRYAFHDGVYWITLGQKPDLLRLQETIASQVTPGEPFVPRSIEEGRSMLERHFEGRSCLLVVDDVWDVQHALAFSMLDPRSRLLVTTRDGAVLTALGAKEEKIDRLPRQAALKLLADWAGQERAGLPVAADGVARECGYLPLALSVAGAHVRDGISWGEALTALREASLEFLQHACGNVFASMRLGVDVLPEDERARYLELAVFPEDERVPESMIL